MFFATNKLQRKRGERVTDYITRFEEGIKTLQDNEINLLTIDDVPGWMLMRKASLTQERRERLTAALPEHFRINDVKRVLIRLFAELHVNEHREVDGQSRRLRTDNAWTLVSVPEAENASHPRRYRSALATGHEWADTESVDEETGVNSADFQGFVRSELEALSAVIDDFPAICRLSLPTKTLRNWSMQRWDHQLCCPSSIDDSSCRQRQNEGQE